MAKRIGSTKTFKSGELAEILGVTVQSISNFRREGMPYYFFDGVGYLYSFTAIKWFIMFKSQSIHENKMYKRVRKSISFYQSRNVMLKHLLSDSETPLSEEEKQEHLKEIDENKKSIIELYSRL